MRKLYLILSVSILSGCVPTTTKPIALSCPPLKAKDVNVVVKIDDSICKHVSKNPIRASKTIYKNKYSKCATSNIRRLEKLSNAYRPVTKDNVKKNITDALLWNKNMNKEVKKLIEEYNKCKPNM